MERQRKIRKSVLKAEIANRKSQTVNGIMGGNMDFSNITGFQKKVYQAALRIPVGYVTTYAEVASYIGCGSPRAVGQALKRNPYAPDVPCHRVIASDLTPGGFQGSRMGAPLKRKIQLLAEEGVTFDEKGRLEDAGRIWHGKKMC